MSRAAAALAGVRERTRWLLEGCDESALTRQHSPLMSPLVWDLAHIAVQEEHWLRRVSRDEPTLLREDVLGLYDAFQHDRASRVELPLLGPAEAWQLADEVRGLVLEALPGDDDDFTWGMVAQHEAQHVETMTATLALRAGDPVVRAAATVPGTGHDLPTRLQVQAGPCLLGVDREVEPWRLDNEGGCHEVHVGDVWLERVPVSAGRWQAFMADGGYQRRELWTAEGWEHRSCVDLVSPLHWRREGDRWWVERFGVLEPVADTDVVQHVCCHEAEAFARWAGGRLPTEQEWEKAASWDPVAGRRRRWPWGEAPPDPTRATLGGRSLRPAPVGSLPASASAFGVEQLIGDVWEWTSSTLTTWPGFEPMVYRDYTVPFAGDRAWRVLRGGSWAVEPVAARPSFRNWDHPVRRQIFAGVRVAYDGPA